MIEATLTYTYPFDIEKLTKAEKTFLAIIETNDRRFCPYINRRNKSKAKKLIYPNSFHPYNNTNFRVDFIIDTPFYGLLGGIKFGFVIEIQGGIYGISTIVDGQKVRKSGHLGGKNTKRDSMKSIIAQYNEFFHLPVFTGYEDMLGTIKFLGSMDKKYNIFYNLESCTKDIQNYVHTMQT